MKITEFRALLSTYLDPANTAEVRMNAGWSLFCEFDSMQDGWDDDVYKPRRHCTNGDVIVEIGENEYRFVPEYDESDEYWEQVETDITDYPAMRKFLVSMEISWRAAE
jgi:hypothetical protein